MKFNYYESDIRKSEPLGSITLERFIDAISNPKPKFKDIFSRIYNAGKSGNLEEKNKLKTHLYSFTPCVFIEGKRRYSNIKNFTGLLVLDFDGLQENYCHEFKQFLFDQYPFIIACWLSASKCGVRALVKIPICNSVDEFKLYFNGISFYHMDQFNGFDHAPKNPVLPLFLSYDADLLFRPFAEEFSTKYSPVAPLPIQQYFSSANPTAVEKIITSSINKITGNGHPQLRAASFALGGYVGAGYIDYQNAENLITNLIHHNGYLSKKPKTYIRTAKEMILKGATKPLYLKLQ
jgi:hypothetical protein